MVNAKELIDFIEKNTTHKLHNCEIQINNNIIVFDLQKNLYKIKNLQGNDHKRIFDLTKLENHSVVMLLLELFEKGYASNNIWLEKCWQSGRTTSDYLDVMLTNPNNGDIIMFEVKTSEELQKNYSNTNNKSKMGQLISYIMHQPKNTKIGSYYAYDFKEKKAYFSNIYCKEILDNATDEQDFYTRWNKVFDYNDFIKNNNLWGINRIIKKYNNLQNIENNDTKNLYAQFLTILRLNSISDKPNAFMKVINLFLCKIADEIKQDIDFRVIDNSNQTHLLNGLSFQFIDGIDTPISFMKRLNDLYKDGMKKYLGKNIIEYSDKDIDAILNGNITPPIKEMIDNLRLKREHNFAFIEVYDDKTFLENFYVVKETVRLLENYKFKYETKHQFLGDFFEDLLNTSLKQEAGQFFTPHPIVDFMVQSLNFSKFITDKIKNNEDDFIPTIIDYACGAGHFLISAMTEIQNILNNKKDTEFITNTQKQKFNSYKALPYSFASRDKIIGIEKDYRLAKTTKIATFLNGDGDACIISGDGINKFSAQEYDGTILKSNNNVLEKFDFVISNPPYSVDGFMQAFRKNGIDKNSNTFTLLINNLNDTNSDIETYFVERTFQLLKNGGMGAIVLPQSILSQDKYEPMRRFIIENFIIKSMLLTADITFSGTTTSPVVLFLKKEKPNILDYDVLIMMSPKYLNPNGSKLKRAEEEFLGYSFSSNRSKSGIAINNNSILQQLINVNKNFISENINVSHQHKNIKIATLSQILLNTTDKYIGDIYPKYEKIGGKPLSNFCKINNRIDEDVSPIGYIEIGDLKTQIPSKNKSSLRLCKKGDILISSLTPRKEQIVIANNDFKVSNAIIVLSDFADENVRDKIFNALKQETILKQMNTMLDGFKITYAKISAENLYNNVLITL